MLQSVQFQSYCITPIPPAMSVTHRMHDPMSACVSCRSRRFATTDGNVLPGNRQPGSSPVERVLAVDVMATLSRKQSTANVYNVYGAGTGEWRCSIGSWLRARVVAERAHLPAPPQYSYHSMFVAATESAALWRCKSCGKEVSNRWHHFHSHTAQRSLCPYCPATYSRIDTLRSHLRLKHAALLLKH